MKHLKHSPVDAPARGRRTLLGRGRRAHAGPVPTYRYKLDCGCSHVGAYVVPRPGSSRECWPSCPAGGGLRTVLSVTTDGTLP